MKLLSLHLPADRSTDLAFLRAIDFRHPVDQVLGWRVLVRGPAIILVTPDGHPKPGGYEFARAACTLRWDSATVQDYDKITTWTSEPLERAKAPSIPDIDTPKAGAK